MTMSHKEALRVAQEAVRERAASMSQFLSKEDFYDEQDTILLRAYLDARGLVMVPKEPTDKQADELTRGFTSGVGLRAGYRKALAAAPDPFGGE